MLKLLPLIGASVCLPCTGERADIWPYVVGGGLLAAAILLIFLKSRKKNEDEDASLNDKQDK